MNKIKLLFLLAVAALACNACDTRDKKLNGRTDNLQEVVNQDINLHLATAACQFGGVDTTVSPSTGRCKIVVYFDDSGCSPCRLKELSCWNPLIREVQQNQLAVDFVFIVRADTSNHAVSQAPSVTKLMSPVIFDPNGEFEESNILPTSSQLHYFLLDNANRVLLLGNPAYHPELWTQFKSAIAAACSMQN